MTDVALNPTETLHLVALDRPQLEEAHAKMIAWAKARLEKVEVDADVEGTAMDLASRNGWATAAFSRRLNVIARQRVFYTKILAAVEAGFAIVPNFAMNVFAIRTKATAPRSDESTWRSSRFAQSAQQLPQGEGEYRNPLPVVFQRTDEKPDGKGGQKTEIVYFPEEFRDDVEFPIALARPELMTRTGQAMAMKLFDEIGVAVDAGSTVGGGRGDPIIIGRLLNPRKNAPALSFFIGWYFDPSRL
jgi:hypothetical protein